MRKLGLILILCSFISGRDLVLEGRINGVFKYFTTDRLGNIFLLTQRNDIQKFDRKGKKITEANFKVMGDATLIDAGNPLELYVFYKDQNKLVYFDNMLNYRGETDLYRTLGVNNVQSVCRSYDNGFWFFDPDNYKLKKADKSGNLLSESINLAGIADTFLSVQMMLDDGKSVFMKVNSDRLLVFDNLGNYVKTIPFEKFTSFQSRDGQILYSTAGGLWLYDPPTFEKRRALPEMPELLNHSWLNIRYDDHSFYFQDSAGISVYASGK